MKKLIFIFMMLSTSFCFSQTKTISALDSVVDISSGSTFIINYNNGSTFTTKKVTWDSLKNILGDSVTIVAAGSDAQIQFNNSGVRAGNDSLTYDDVNVCLAIGESTAEDYANLLIDETNADNTTSGHTGIYLNHWRSGGAGSVSRYTDGLYIYNSLNITGYGGYLAGGTIWNVNASGDVGTTGSNRNMIGLDVQNANYDNVYGNSYGIKVKNDNTDGSTLEDNLYGIYIDIDQDGTVGGASYGLYINSQTDIDYGAYIGGNVGITGTITGNTVYKSWTQYFDMTSIDDTTNVVPNEFGVNATVDSIYTLGFVNDQQLTVITIPEIGGTPTIIDIHTVSTDGRAGTNQRFYNHETTLTSTVWEKGSTMCILKEGTDTKLLVTVFFHYVEQKGS